MTLIPEFVEGRLVRYVINTDDALGHALDLRKDTGHFSGTITPIVSYGTDTVSGVSTPVAFEIAPVQAGRLPELRDRRTSRSCATSACARSTSRSATASCVVCQEAYKGVNIDFRTDPVTDFALFSNVDLVGVDPNNMGLFGYDNSPGKDNGNLRLYDELGGVNASTQQDGYPGYGGVFVRSLMAFSQHPGAFAQTRRRAPIRRSTRSSIRSVPIGGGAADHRRGSRATSPTSLTDGSACPATDRQDADRVRDLRDG